MATNITAEQVFSKHATALGLKPLEENQTVDAYIEKYADGDEAKRCFKEAWDAAGVADHAQTAHWLDQARQHVKK